MKIANKFRKIFFLTETENSRIHEISSQTKKQTIHNLWKLVSINIILQ